MVILADILVDSLGFTSGIIVVAGGDDIVDVPAVDQCGDISFSLSGIAKVADNRKSGRGLAIGGLAGNRNVCGIDIQADAP